MTNPSLIQARLQSGTLTKQIYLSTDWDDDDDADDDDDDEISQGSWRGQPWLSRSEFGSPEWWSRA